MFRSIIAAYRAAFAGLPRDCWILALVALVNRSGTMVLPFLALYLTRERGFSAEQAGRFVALYGLGSMLGSYVGGRLSDVFSPRRIQIASLLLGGLMWFLLGQLRTPFSIGIALFCAAAILDALRPANMAAFAAASPPDRRTRAFALNRLAINLGVTVGPALGGFLAVRDYGLLFMVDGGTCIAAGLMMIVLLSDRPRPTASERSVPKASPWSDRLFIGFLVFGFVSSLVFFQLESSFPLYLNERYGLPEDRIGVMYAVNTILIVTFEMVLVRRVESWSLLKTIALGTLLNAIGFGLLPFGSTTGFVVFTVVIWTFGEMLSAPMMTSFVSSRASDANRGRYLGMFNIAFASGFVLAPIAGTSIYQRLGADQVWYLTFVVGVVSAAGLFLLDRLNASAPRPAPTDAVEQ